MRYQSILSLLKSRAYPLVDRFVWYFDRKIKAIALFVLKLLVYGFVCLLYIPAQELKSLMPILLESISVFLEECDRLQERCAAKLAQLTSTASRLLDDGLVMLGMGVQKTLSIPLMAVTFFIQLTFASLAYLTRDIQLAFEGCSRRIRSKFSAHIKVFARLQLVQAFYGVLIAALDTMQSLLKPAAYGAILATAVIGTTSNADVADEMKVLIEQKKSAEAYALGTKHPELMGDPLFDYFYGVAATETGHVSMGVLALERVLLNDPNNDLVRLELARAYYAQAEYQRAKDEFLAVKKNQPPAGVVSTINVYLDDIKEKEGQYKAVYGVYVELGMGYNNNVNAATAVNNIILPYIGPITLGASSRPLKSMFGYDTVGASVAVPITSDVSAFANANTSAQRYSQVNGYNLNVTNATTGVKISDGPNTYKIAGFGSIAQIDQVPVPNTYGGGGEYVRQLTDTDSVMLAAGSTVLQYPSQFNAYNSTLNIGTVGYRKAFPATMWKPVIDLAANTAHQTDTSNRPDLGRRIAGASIQASFLPAEKVGVTIGAGYSQSKYDANDLLYQASRTDNLYSGNLVLQYKLTKELSARMEVTYYNNLSNLSLYGYEQWTGAIKLRYDWSSN